MERHGKRMLEQHGMRASADGVCETRGHQYVDEHRAAKHRYMQVEHREETGQTRAWATPRRALSRDHVEDASLEPREEHLEPTQYLESVGAEEGASSAA